MASSSASQSPCASRFRSSAIWARASSPYKGGAPGGGVFGESDGGDSAASAPWSAVEALSEIRAARARPSVEAARVV